MWPDPPIPLATQAELNMMSSDSESERGGRGRGARGEEDMDVDSEGTGTAAAAAAAAMAWGDDYTVIPHVRGCRPLLCALACQAGRGPGRARAEQWARCVRHLCGARRRCGA